MAINIAGLDKADVLAALYNRSKPLGFGMLHFVPGDMSKEEASKLIESTPGLYFDYVRGRVIKACLDADVLDEYLYDRDNGSGAAVEALSHLTSSQQGDEP